MYHSESVKTLYIHWLLLCCQQYHGKENKNVFPCLFAVVEIQLVFDKITSGFTVALYHDFHLGIFLRGKRHYHLSCRNFPQNIKHLKLVKLSLSTPLRHRSGIGIQLHSFITSRSVHVNGHLYDQYCTSTEKGVAVPIE